MRTLTELAEDCGADLDTVHPLATKIIFHDEADLQKLIDAHNKQLSEPIYQVSYGYNHKSWADVNKDFYVNIKRNDNFKRIVYLAPQISTAEYEQLTKSKSVLKRHAVQSCTDEIKNAFEIAYVKIRSQYLEHAIEFTSKKENGEYLYTSTRDAWELWQVATTQQAEVIAKR